MRLHNTRTRTTEDFTPMRDNTVRMYSCGPTVYNNVTIGNLSAFIYADILRRGLKIQGYDVQHVMNFTDVDDKTIRRSGELYPDLQPMEALRTLTTEYTNAFLDDMAKIGNDTNALTFISAADQTTIAAMQDLIRELHQAGYAYVTDDGIYFSIEAYKKDGKTYGQLLELSTANTSQSRIDNDEYDKESVHDFALWKKQKGNEPAWSFMVDDHDMTGRPGWHIECSAMSRMGLGTPFDIHTGGIDLIFPHHENEIAQSTAGNDRLYANFFVHNEHLLVDGKKMSKSLGNFYTLQDLAEKGIHPLAFRMLMLQSHYAKSTNLNLNTAKAADARLKDIRAFADLRFQANTIAEPRGDIYFNGEKKAIIAYFGDNLAVPAALARLSAIVDEISALGINEADTDTFTAFVSFLDEAFGLQLGAGSDIQQDHKERISQREQAREQKEWSKSDELRDQLASEGIGVRDTAAGTIWFRL